MASAVQSARRRGAMSYQVELEPTVVVGPADRIGRAVSNLIDNARKWSPQEGRIEVELADGVLTVRDHGPGFSEQDLPFVFDRFYRAERPGDCRARGSVWRSSARRASPAAGSPKRRTPRAAEHS